MKKIITLVVFYLLSTQIEAQEASTLNVKTDPDTKWWAGIIREGP